MKHYIWKAEEEYGLEEFHQEMPDYYLSLEILNSFRNNKSSWNDLILNFLFEPKGFNLLLLL